MFQHLHIDFAEPFQGATFFMVVDAYSKWPQAVIMPSTTVSSTIEFLRQIFSMFGVPEHIVSDNCAQFTSTFMAVNVIKCSLSATYHPSTNELGERFVQSLNQGLKASLSSGLSLTHRLSNFLMTHSTTGVSPSSLFLKRELRTRFDLLRPDPEARVQDKQLQQKDCDSHAQLHQFSDILTAFRVCGTLFRLLILTYPYLL